MHSTASSRVAMLYLILTSTSMTASLLASFILILMCIHHLYKCVSRRLWLFPCYPAPFISLNAGTLSLIAFSIIPSFLQDVDDDEIRIDFDFFYTLIGSVLASAFIGACMPSLATADRRQIWSNAAGAALLLITIVSNILRTAIYPRTPYEISSVCVVLIIITMICISLDIPILIVQACNSDVMISEVAVCMSIRLQQLEINDPKSISEPGGHLYWIIWEDLERRTYVKLMMALTSNLQNVASRSPSSAILAITFLVTAAAASFALVLHTIDYISCIFYIPLVSALLLGIICVNRWLTLAIHDYRPLRSVLFDTHPFYRHQKMIDIWLHLRDGPPRRLQATSIWQLTTFTLKRIYFLSAFFMLSFIIPMQWILMVCIRFTHASTTLFVRVLKPPLRRMLTWLSSIKAPALEEYSTPPNYACLDAGVIHIPGEDPCIVGKLFAASAKRVIQRQMKQAATKSTIALETLLQLSNQACFFKSNVVYEVLDERGIPAVSELLHARCHYGDEYGWSLTALSLLVVMSKVEVAALGTSKATMAAMEAYEQAMQMVEVVDEMHRPLICSKDKYLKASASLWSSLMSKSRSWSKASRHVKENFSVVDTLDVMMASAMSQLQRSAHASPWTMEVVKAYTMYTVCKNLQSWCTLNSAELCQGSTYVVEHIEFLMAEVLAACLCSLPAVLETCTRRAVCNGHVAQIENAILLVCQGRKIWKKLQWPQCKVDQADVPVPGFPLNQYWLQHRTSFTHVAEQQPRDQLARP